MTDTEDIFHNTLVQSICGSSDSNIDPDRFQIEVQKILARHAQLPLDLEPAFWRALVRTAEHLARTTGIWKEADAPVELGVRAWLLSEEPGELSSVPRFMTLVAQSTGREYAAPFALPVDKTIDADNTRQTVDQRRPLVFICPSDNGDTAPISHEGIVHFPWAVYHGPFKDTRLNDWCDIPICREDKEGVLGKLSLDLLVEGACIPEWADREHPTYLALAKLGGLGHVGLAAIRECQRNQLCMDLGRRFQEIESARRDSEKPKGLRRRLEGALHVFADTVLGGNSASGFCLLRMANSNNTALIKLRAVPFGPAAEHSCQVELLKEIRRQGEHVSGRAFASGKPIVVNNCHDICIPVDSSPERTQIALRADPALPAAYNAPAANLRQESLLCYPILDPVAGKKCVVGCITLSVDQPLAFAGRLEYVECVAKLLGQFLPKLHREAKGATGESRDAAGLPQMNDLLSSAPIQGMMQYAIY